MYTFTKKIVLILVIAFFAILSAVIGINVLDRPKSSTPANQTVVNRVPSSSVFSPSVTNANLSIQGVETNDRYTIDILLDSDALISAIDIGIRYPLDVLEYQEVVFTDFYEDFLELPVNVDTTEGLINVSAASLTPRSGNASLVRVVFKRTTQAHAEVQIVSAVASSPDYDRVNIIHQ